MKAVLELELIGDHLYGYQSARQRGHSVKSLSLMQEIEIIRYASRYLKPWVARISYAGNTTELHREFLRYDQKDYARANSIGSRGVYAYYILSSGIYEVNERTGWQTVRRYYIRVEGDQITEISRQEVYRCLSAAT